MAMEVPIMSKEGKKSSGIGVIVVAFLLILLIICSVWIYLIRTNNFINLGERIRPYIKDTPIINLILPPPLEDHDPTVYSREELEQLFKTLSQQNEELTESKLKLEEENSSLKEVEEKYNILLTEVESLKNVVSTFDAATQEEIKEIESKQSIANLVKVYETMEAADAAKILEEMGTLNISLVMEIFKSMKSNKIAEIMQEMDTDFAAILSERMIAD
jgi:flagellar motility protein MotE (MotC chaperone)